MSNAPIVLRVKILGDFRLYAGEREITDIAGRSSKLRSILCYLILHRERAVSRNELIEVFYEDENQSDPVSALKMQIMRIRRMLAPALGTELSPIVSLRGAYQWNPQLPCWVDAEEFELLCLEAEQPDRTQEQSCAAWRKALELYDGDPTLEKDDLVWSGALKARFHSRYVTAAEAYAGCLLSQGSDSQAEKICMEAVERDPASEALHVLLLRTLLKQRRYPEARKIYKRISDNLYQSLGVRPSAELQQLGAAIAGGILPAENDLDLVMTGMREGGDDRKAFFCGFEQFRSIYQLEARRAPRTGTCLHVAMIKVEDCHTDAVMERVQQAILQNLRQSDVVARYSGSQFIIMLPEADLEDSQRVIRRVADAYRRQHPRGARLSWQIRELEIL